MLCHPVVLLGCHEEAKRLVQLHPYGEGSNVSGGAGVGMWVELSHGADDVL